MRRGGVIKMDIGHAILFGIGAGTLYSCAFIYFAGGDITDLWEFAWFAIPITTVIVVAVRNCLGF